MQSVVGASVVDLIKQFYSSMLGAVAPPPLLLSSLY
jgi:hypothetical protein